MVDLYKSIVVILFLLVCTPTFGQQFVNPIGIPPLIESSRTNYKLNAIETMHNFNPNGNDSMNVMIPSFAFEDADNPGTTTILGPSIAWEYGNWETPEVTNKLDEVTTCHWHGAHVPPHADGGPHQRIQPGNTWKPEFRILDKSATMWYHPHAMGLTYEHVQMGLSGMIYVEDPDGEDSLLTAIHHLLPTSYGVNDFPLIFQTKKFKRDTGTGEIIIQSIDGYKQDYVYLVNGRMDPFLTVPQNMVRFRILNGDGKFAFNLGLSADENLMPLGFHMIATDAGYVDQSFELDEVVMAPGERTEWLIDFRKYNVGDTVYIYNKVSDLPDGVIGNAKTTNGYAKDRLLLQLIVGPDNAPVSPITDFPLELVPLETPPLSAVTNTRVKTFRQDPFLVDSQVLNLFNIDSTLMNMMVVNDVVKLDSTELWTLDNTTGIAHPFHIHDIHFWVTEIVDSVGVTIDKSKYPYIFNGPKDDIFVLPGWKLTFIATFSDFGNQVAFDSSYMMHCHILPHEDRGMMGQFVVWNGDEGEVNTELPDISSRPIKVFPNPSNDYLFIEGESRASSFITIIDMKGQVVRKFNLTPIDGLIRIDCQAIPPGNYILNWHTDEGLAVCRMTKI